MDVGTCMWCICSIDMCDVHVLYVVDDMSGLYFMCVVYVCVKYGVCLVCGVYVCVMYGVCLCVWCMVYQWGMICVAYGICVYHVFVVYDVCI